MNALVPPDARCCLHAGARRWRAAARHSLSDRSGEDDYDHERARRAVEAGLASCRWRRSSREVGDRLGGEVVGVEFEREYGRYVYEFKIVTPAGRLREVYVDAMSAEVLKTEDD
jgi:uncharacterized membrane protein YkoI